MMGSHSIPFSVLYWCRIALISCALFVSFSAAAQKFIGTRLEYLPGNEQSELFDVEKVVQSDDWIAFDQLVPNLGLGDEFRWMRLTLDPRTENGKLIEIQNAGIDDLTCYMVCDGKVIANYSAGIMNAVHEGQQF